MRRLTTLPAMGRCVVSLLGSFNFTRGLDALGVAARSALRVEYQEAEVTMMLLALLVFPPLFLWSFASPRQGRVEVLLFGRAALMTASLDRPRFFSVECLSAVSPAPTFVQSGWPGYPVVLVTCLFEADSQ
jgi:hypothetical protein